MQDADASDAADVAVGDVTDGSDAPASDVATDAAADAGTGPDAALLLKMTDVVWTYLDATAADATIPAGLPPSSAASLPDLPAGCWSKPHYTGNRLFLADLHVFSDGSFLIYTGSGSDPLPPSAVWHMKNNGKVLLKVALPEAGKGGVYSNPGFVASGPDGTAVLVWEHDKGTQLFWYDKSGNVEAEATVAMPLPNSHSMALGAAGFLFVGVANTFGVLPKFGIVGLSKGGASGWFLPLPEKHFVANVLPGHGALASGSHGLRVLSQEGKWTAEVKNFPDTDNDKGWRSIIPDGNGGMYAMLLTDTYYNKFNKFVSVARLDSSAGIIWVEPYLMSADPPYHTLAMYSVGSDDFQYIYSYPPVGPHEGRRRCERVG